MEIEEFVNRLCERIVRYMEDADKPGKLVDFVPAASLSKTTDVHLPLEGRGAEAVFDDIDEFLRHCVKTNRSEFMNPLWGGLTTAGFAGEVIAALTNTSMYTYELAPFATLVEQAILKRMGELVGFSGGAGTLATGGSNGNMLGMLCAREVAFPSSTYKGIDGTKMAAFVSEESHYSVLMSANVIGIGHRNLFKIACDEDGRMRPAALLEEIQRAKTEGLTPFCVVSTSGTTVRGAFDPLKAIGQIAHDEGIWHHVDAAWGGSAMFSSELSKLMDGVEFADSVCWDAHKMMGLPLTCSAFLVKQSEVLAKVCAHGNVAHYLFHESSRDHDLGRYSLQCGRRNDALKLWLAWRECGDAGWSNLVENYVALADHLQSRIDEDDNLEMMSARSWTNVCFRYVPTTSGMNLNEVNSEVRLRIMQNADFMVSRSNIGDDVVIRSVISNPRITEDSLDAFINEVLRIGKDVEQGLPRESMY
jgi:glutamate/tyrosine decarboxylase-like PLP-dependent enzyme